MLVLILRTGVVMRHCGRSVWCREHLLVGSEVRRVLGREGVSDLCACRRDGRGEEENVSGRDRGGLVWDVCCPICSRAAVRGLCRLFVGDRRRDLAPC